MRKQILALAGLALAGLSAAPAQAADVTLTIQHFLSPKAPAHAAFIEPWAKHIEEQSKGRIAFEIFPSMSLGGKPPELYRQVRDGTVDIVWTLLGYTPGTFPRTEVFELPGVHKGSAEATTLAIQDVYDQFLAEEFQDIHPILLHVHTGQAIHMVDKPVRALADLKGLKLRTPSRTGAWVIESWDAEPVGMPVPELPQALSKGVIDGALIPFEIVAPLKVQELTKYSIEGINGERFGTSVFLYGMNKERYEALPDDLRAIIDANSGANIAQDIGKVWDAIEPKVKAMVEEHGNEIIKLDAAVLAEFDAKAATVTQRWIDEVTASGIDGKALVAAAQAAVAKHSGQ